ncbi:MAG: aminotransferase class III-fold pyridoxal phosphate-dependent enzyme, partial [Anaerolineae bacterium]|nr:aminotransferase class III-fold pyridoxal phosphate-dependent enzyme [Anaerolineae bacterium]
DQIAAIILEPVAGNMGVVPPSEGFLTGLRKMTGEQGALLIFDEVMTGFRVHPGGAQTLFNIQPDLTTLGKVIGGGLPVGAYGGKRQIMEMIAPSGSVYQAGTLSGNPLAMTAGIATLRKLQTAGMWDKLEAAAGQLTGGLGKIFSAASVPFQQTRVGTMFSTFFTPDPVKDWSTVKKSDTGKFGAFFQGMLENNIYLAPSQFEAGFISTVHSETEINATLAAAEKALK